MSHIYGTSVYNDKAQIIGFQQTHGFKSVDEIIRERLACMSDWLDAMNEELDYIVELGSHVDSNRGSLVR